MTMTNRNHDTYIFCRSKIEQEYAQKLRRLTKNYIPKQKGDDYKFTGIKAFSMMLNEVNDMAGQHELIAENLSTAVVADLSTLIKSLKDDRRRQLQVKMHINYCIYPISAWLNIFSKKKNIHDRRKVS